MRFQLADESVQSEQNPGWVVSSMEICVSEVEKVSSVGSHTGSGHGAGREKRHSMPNGRPAAISLVRPGEADAITQAVTVGAAAVDAGWDGLITSYLAGCTESQWNGLHAWVYCVVVQAMGNGEAHLYRSSSPESSVGRAAMSRAA